MPLFFPPAPTPTLIQNEAIAYSGNSTLALTANNVYVYAFEIAGPVTITAVRWRMGGTATGHSNMALYTFAGSLVSGSDTGAQVNTASAANTFTYSTAISLQAGQYYLALACDNSTDTYLGGAVTVATDALSRARVATNALSAGAMPSTLGTISTVAKQPAMAALTSGGLS